MTHVPYKGGAPALADLVGGHINVMMTSLVVSKAHIEAGRLTPLAVAWNHRLEPLPNVPTTAEAGYPLDAAYWFGLMAPAGTPPAVIGQLEKALAETVAQAEVRKRLAAPHRHPDEHKEFGAFIRADSEMADAVKPNVKDSIRTNRFRHSTYLAALIRNCDLRYADDGKPIDANDL
jgi:tripartite-type tricarboxylate transporter receptor subunit TctC